MRDRSVLDRVALGMHAIYHICPNVHPDEVPIGRAAIGAAVSGGVLRFVFHSVLHPQATARQLAALQERRLERYDVVALILDGKRSSESTMVIALGITLRGGKVLLSFVQTGTENAAVCATFLRGVRWASSGGSSQFLPGQSVAHR